VVPYVAILVRGEDETWRAYLPDFTGCRAEGVSPEVALRRAKNRARELTCATKRSAPRSLIEIRDDPTWARDRGIDWQDAIVVMVTLEL
jgi:predicted RNase H-like HicB family nuclease